MYSTYITNDVWTIINVSILLYWYTKKSSKILWSQTEIAVLNKYTIHILWVQIVFNILYMYLKKHDKIQHVLPTWHGLRTGLIWTVNKYRGINKRKSPEIKQNLKVLLPLDYQEFQNYFSSRQKWDRTRLALPRFCHFSGPPMQGYTHRQCIQPDTSKAQR